MNPSFVFLTALLPNPAVESTSPAPVAVAESHTEGAPAEVKWTGNVAIGATYTDGNTDTRGVNASADAERRGAEDRWTAKGYWNYAEQKTNGDNQITTRKGGASLKYDYFLSKKVFLFGIAGWETDTLANIEDRMYAGAGLGYQWREDDSLKWSSEAGVTYFAEDFFDDGDPTTDDSNEYIAARLANNVAWQINEKTKLENLVEVFPSLEDSDDFYGKSDTKVSTSLTEKMFAQLQWVWQYDNTPASSRDRNDNALILGVGWSF